MHSRILVLWSGVAVTSFLAGCSAPSTVRPFAKSPEAAEIQRYYDKVDRAFVSNSGKKLVAVYGSFAAAGFKANSGTGNFTLGQMLDQIALQVGVVEVKKSSTVIRWSKDERKGIYIEYTRKIDSLGKDGHLYQLTATFDDRWIRAGSSLKLLTQTSSSRGLLMDGRLKSLRTSCPFPLSLSFPDPVKWSNMPEQTNDFLSYIANVVSTKNSTDIHRYLDSICTANFYYSVKGKKMNAGQFAERLHQLSKASDVVELFFGPSASRANKASSSITTSETLEELLTSGGGQYRVTRLTVTYQSVGGTVKISSIREIISTTHEAPEIIKALIRNGKIR